MTNPIRQTIGLPPTETVAFFRAKGVSILTSHWTDLWQEEHTRARTIAGVTDLAVLNRVYAELDVVKSKGGTLAMFKAALLADLEKAVAEGKAPARLLTDRGLATVYNTNLRMARAAGKWQRIQELKDVAPYLMYTALLDGRTRPLHLKWNGTILPVDHPWWNTHFPPCGWNCRCSVIQLSEADITDRGLKVADAPPDDGPNHDFIRGDGIVESVPAGIDPGFAYNVGEAHLRGLSDALTAQLETMAGNNVSIAQAVLQQVVDETAFNVFLEQPGNNFPVMVLADAERALIGSESSVVTLSSDTFAKQLREHPELVLADYRKLVELGARPEIIMRQGDLRIVLLKTDGGKWIKAIVKLTKDGQQLFMVSYQFATAREIARLRLRNEVVRDVE